MRKPLAVIRTSLIALASIPAVSMIAGLDVLHANKAGPPPGVTGGYYEPHCGICHGLGPHRGPDEGIRLTTIPPEYTPGKSYPITISVSAHWGNMNPFGFGLFTAIPVIKGKAPGI